MTNGVGRILMRDREAVRISAVEGGRLPGVIEETAVWHRAADMNLTLSITVSRRIDGVDAE